MKAKKIFGIALTAIGFMLAIVVELTTKWPPDYLGWAGIIIGVAMVIVGPYFIFVYDKGKD